MKLISRLIRWAIFLGCIAAAAYGVYYYMQPKPFGVDVAEVTTGPLVVTVNEDGKTRIKDRYIVSAPLSGRLSRVRLKPGMEVFRDSTMLTSIAPRNPELLNKRERLQAEKRVEASKAAMDRAIPIAEAAKSAYEYAKQHYTRIKPLVSQKSVTKDQLAKALSERKVKEQEYRAAIYAQHISKFEYDVAKAALVRTRAGDEPDVSDFVLMSPIDGVILRVLQESATVVTPGAPLLEVGDSRDLEVVVDVLSSDAVAIEPEAEVTLERWGGDEPLHGTVQLVEPAAFTKLSALGVEEQRVNVVIDIVEPSEDRQTLGDGYRVEARIVTWKTDEAVKVPSASLFRADEAWAVFTVDATKVARLQRIKIGRQNDLEAEVIKGLKSNETVILHPSDKIQDGVLVQIRE